MYDINDLTNCVGKITGKDREFANSLIEKSKRWGLSPKQLFWVDKLVKAAKGEDQAETVAIGDLTATVALFDKAKTHLKNPKVLLFVGNRIVRLNVAGERARVPGSINVASLSRYGEGEWYGRITRDGKFSPTAQAVNVPGLAEALKTFADNPAEVATEYGRLTGNCCFCGKALSDERSTAVGYGATCASHYGLAWGAKPVEFAGEVAA